MRSRPTPLPDLPKEGKLPVTKIDAAVRQLETAITLWFHDGDPVSICTLTHAAHGIIHVLNKHFGGKPMMIDSDMIKPEFKDEWQAVFKAAPNFMKHSGKDPHATFFLTVKNQAFELVDCISTYAQWGLGKRPIFETFLLWLWISEPRYFKIPPNHIKPADLEQWRREGKVNFYGLMVGSFARAIATGKR